MEALEEIPGVKMEISRDGEFVPVLDCGAIKSQTQFEDAVDHIHNSGLLNEEDSGKNAQPGVTKLYSSVSYTNSF